MKNLKVGVDLMRNSSKTNEQKNVFLSTPSITHRGYETLRARKSVDDKEMSKDRKYLLKEEIWINDGALFEA